MEWKEIGARHGSIDHNPIKFATYTVQTLVEALGACQQHTYVATTTTSCMLN